MTDEQIKKLIGIFTIGGIAAFILFIIVKGVFFNKKNTDAPDSQITIEEFEDKYHLSDRFAKFLSDTDAQSMRIVCDGTYSYAASSPITYNLDIDTKAVVNEKDAKWIRLDNTTSMTISADQLSEKESDSENSVSFIQRTDEYVYSYVQGEDGAWFYSTTDLSEEDAAVPSSEDLKPLVEYLFNYRTKELTNENGTTQLEFHIYTRDNAFVNVLNTLNSDLVAQNLFNGLVSYETELSITVNIENEKITFYSVETDDKEVAFDYYCRLAKFSAEEMIATTASFKTEFSAAKTEVFTVPEEVKNAISEEEWLKEDKEEPSENKEKEGSSEEKASEEPEKGQEEPTEVPSEEEPKSSAKIDVNDKDAVLEYLRKTLSTEEKEELEQEEEEDPMSIEEIREKYADELQKFLDNYEEE